MSQNDRGNQGRSEEDADDVRLMQLVGRGDTQAFEQLIEKHQAVGGGHRCAHARQHFGCRRYRAASLYPGLEKCAPICSPRQVYDLAVENCAQPGV